MSETTINTCLGSILLYLMFIDEFNKSVGKRHARDHIKCRVKISNSFLEIWSPNKVIEYLLVAFIASSAVSSAIPGKTAADLPTNALWLNSAVE